MTADLIRLYRDMPQDLSRADLDAATDAHVSALRQNQTSHAHQNAAAQTYADTQRGLYLRPAPHIEATAIKATRRRNRALFIAVALGLAGAVTADHLITQSNAARIAAEFDTAASQ